MAAVKTAVIFNYKEKMDIKIVVLCALVIAGATLVAVFAAKRPAGGNGLYKRGKLLTDNELEFFGRLISAMPHHFIFPQVSMGTASR